MRSSASALLSVMEMALDNLDRDGHVSARIRRVHDPVMLANASVRSRSNALETFYVPSPQLGTLMSS